MIGLIINAHLIREGTDTLTQIAAAQGVQRVSQLMTGWISALDQIVSPIKRLGLKALTSLRFGEHGWTRRSMRNLWASTNSRFVVE